MVLICIYFTIREIFPVVHHFNVCNINTECRGKKSIYTLNFRVICLSILPRLGRMKSRSNNHIRYVFGRYDYHITFGSTCIALSPTLKLKPGTLSILFTHSVIGSSYVNVTVENKITTPLDIIYNDNNIV